MSDLLLSILRANHNLFILVIFIKEVTPNETGMEFSNPFEWLVLHFDVTTAILSSCKNKYFVEIDWKEPLTVLVRNQNN